MRKISIKILSIMEILIKILFLLIQNLLKNQRNQRKTVSIQNKIKKKHDKMSIKYSIYFIFVCSAVEN